jgi:hypothetical protein
MRNGKLVSILEKQSSAREEGAGDASGVETQKGMS